MGGGEKNTEREGCKDRQGWKFNIYDVTMCHGCIHGVTHIFAWNVNGKALRWKPESDWRRFDVSKITLMLPLADVCRSIFVAASCFMFVLAKRWKLYHPIDKSWAHAIEREETALFCMTYSDMIATQHGTVIKTCLPSIIHHLDGTWRTHH